MSLYRQPGRVRAPVLAAAAVAALVIGGAIGFALGRSSAPDPSARDVVSRLRLELRPAVNGLQLLPTEYPQAYRGAGNERAAVRGAMARIRAAVARARPDLGVLDPAGLRNLEQGVAALQRAVDAKAPPAQVARSAQTLAGVLAAVPGGG